MDIFNESFERLLAEMPGQEAEIPAKNMRIAADRGSIAADKVLVKGFGYTFSGTEYVKSPECPTVTEFELKENVLRINDILGECEFARALIFTKRFARRLRQRFEGIVFIVTLSLQGGDYLLGMCRYRPHEGQWYDIIGDIKSKEYPFGTMLGCVKLRMTQADDCFRITAYDEEGQPAAVPEDIFPADMRGELIMISPEESGSGREEAMYSYACCGEQGRSILAEEAVLLRRYAENLQYYVITEGSIYDKNSDME